MNQRPAIASDGSRVRDELGTRYRRVLIAILALYVALASLYSVVNPLFEAPDETWHYGFIWHLRTGQGLPVVSLNPTTGPAMQEALQPPLYYGIAAALTTWVPREQLTAIVKPNPAATIHTANPDGDVRSWVLLRPDRFPYTGEFLAAHIARLVSVACGALTLLATWLLARHLAPDRPVVWIIAATLTAAIPQFVFISSAVSNDAMAACAASWGLLLSVRTAQRRPAASRSIGLGLVAGLGALSKLSVLGLIPLGLLALAIANRREGPKRLAGQTALFVGAILAVSGWWFVRNLVLYGDPLGIRAFVLASGGSGQAALNLGSIGGDLLSLWMSFWAVFGWFNLQVDSAVYIGYAILTIASTIGLIALLLEARIKQAARQVPIAVSALWLVLIAAAFANYQLYLDAWQGRLLFPALAPICVFLALGLSRLPWGHTQPLVIATFVGISLTVTAAMPFRYIGPAYAEPTREASVILKDIPHPIGAQFGGQLELVGSSRPPTAVQPGTELTFDLYWRATERMERDYTVSVQLLDNAGDGLAQTDGQPENGAFPTRAWEIGDALRDTYRLQVPDDVSTPQVGRIIVRVYPTGGSPLEVTDTAGATSEEIELARIRIADAITPAPSDSGLASFGGQIRLVSATLESDHVRPGDAIQGRITWSAVQVPDADYTVFIHLLRGNEKVAQVDAEPLGGAYPTSYWRLGEAVKDHFELRLPANIQPGEYHLIAGMYNLETQQRLRTTDNDFTTIGTVEVVN